MIQSVIKKDAVRVHGEQGAPKSEAAPAAPLPRHTKRVRALPVDGVVRAIEITCSCGEVTLVELEYPGPTETPR